jgi:hypothetical protein
MDGGSSNGKKLLRSFINATKDKTPGVRVAACRLLGMCYSDVFSVMHLLFSLVGAISLHRISKQRKADIATPCANALLRYNTWEAFSIPYFRHMMINLVV